MIATRGTPNSSLTPFLKLPSLVTFACFIVLFLHVSFVKELSNKNVSIWQFKLPRKSGNLWSMEQSIFMFLHSSSKVLRNCKYFRLLHGTESFVRTYIHTHTHAHSQTYTFIHTYRISLRSKSSYKWPFPFKFTDHNYVCLFISSCPSNIIFLELMILTLFSTLWKFLISFIIRYADPSGRTI
jgi:hypothetical protein